MQDWQKKTNIKIKQLDQDKQWLYEVETSFCELITMEKKNSWRPGLGWCRRSNDEKRSWLFPLGWTVQQSKVVGCCPEIQALAVRGCCVVTPVDMLAVEVANVQIRVWERRDGRWSESRAWRFVDVDDLVICNVHPQPLSLWLIWKLIGQWPFQPLVDRRGKAVIPVRDWPS